MKKWKVDKSWTLFLDRDGVINERIFGGYVESIDQFIFKKGSLESLIKFNLTFGKIIIVTNQQCIAKEIISMEQLNNIHMYMLEEIEKIGGRVDRIYVATELKDSLPHHRKPNSSMALKAQNDFNDIDFRKSIMVGDTDSDIEFGKNLGMKTVLMKSKEVTFQKPDISINSLNELCDYFLSYY